MNINIPCPSCGCQNCNATDSAGTSYKIQICRCPDGSGEYEVSIIPSDRQNAIWEKYQCGANEVASSLTHRYNIDHTTIHHQCF